MIADDQRMPRGITLDAKYDPAMKITDQRDADEYFERCVEHSMREGMDRAEAEKVERENIGYWAGYFDHDTRRRVEHLFHCAHPIFGAISAVGAPTAEEAFQMGYDAAQRLKRSERP